MMYGVTTEMKLGIYKGAASHPNKGHWTKMNVA
jgi:hypothetical protein